MWRCRARRMMGSMPEAKPISPPALALLALEGRAVLEFGALVAAWPVLALSPRGDGHPVLVLPGFLASDRSTTVFCGSCCKRRRHCAAARRADRRPCGWVTSP